MLFPATHIFHTQCHLSHLSLDGAHVVEEDVELVVVDLALVVRVLQEPNLAALFKLPVPAVLGPSLQIPAKETRNFIQRTFQDFLASYLMAFP